MVDLGWLTGDLAHLARGHRARMQAEEHLFGDDDKGALFEGTYLVSPAENCFCATATAD